jgi:hypothetical protein
MKKLQSIRGPGNGRWSQAEAANGQADTQRLVNDPLMAAQANGKTASHVPRWTPTFAARLHGFRQLREK